MAPEMFAHTCVQVWGTGDTGGRAQLGSQSHRQKGYGCGGRGGCGSLGDPGVPGGPDDRGGPAVSTVPLVLRYRGSLVLQGSRCSQGCRWWSRLSRGSRCSQGSWLSRGSRCSQSSRPYRGSRLFRRAAARGRCRAARRGRDGAKAPKSPNSRYIPQSWRGRPEPAWNGGLGLCCRPSCSSPTPGCSRSGLEPSLKPFGRADTSTNAVKLCPGAI